MKHRFIFFAAAALLRVLFSAELWAQTIAISYPGLSGESSSLWMASEGGFFKENGLDAKLVYMEGGRLSIKASSPATRSSWLETRCRPSPPWPAAPMWCC
ncbi:MAG: hypothetical protein ABW172_12900 [Candidatus Binatia bacterium]